MASEKKKKKSGATVQIYSRVRKLMPWEPKKISVKVMSDTVIQNHTAKGSHEYQFNHIFGMKKDNEAVYKRMCKPMIKKVLDGYNAVLIAYGQTGSGKTHTLVGKPEQNVKGVLTMSLEALINEKTVKSVFVSGVEAYGTHVSRIELFDLFNATNASTDWTIKKGNASADPHKAATREVKTVKDCFDKINEAHDASHFAPTGKNPESSRGHVAFVAQVNQEIDGELLTSFFVCVDLAGSEGESAFTKEFVRKVDQATLMARRLEAGVINTGLSQLQVVFNELKVKGKLSKVKGNGLRRILHAYINNRCVISVCFTISPAKNNAVTTASTLKFAVQAGMVQVKPVKAQKQVNWKQLVDELNAHIADQDKIISELNDNIAEFQDQLDDLETDLDRARKEISQLMLEAAKGDSDKDDPKRKDIHDRAQASVHKLAPSIASLASMKGYLTRKESNMSLSLRMNLQTYKKEVAYYDDTADDPEIDDGCVASGISEAQVDAKMKRKIHERAQSNVDMQMVNKVVPQSKPKSQGKGGADESKDQQMDVNIGQYGLVQGADNNNDSPKEKDGQSGATVSFAPNVEDNESDAKTPVGHVATQSQASVVMKAGTVREIEMPSDEEDDEEVDFQQLAQSATLRVHPDGDENDDGDAKQAEDDGAGFDDLEGESPMGVEFKHKDTSNMSREEVVDYCDELETYLIEEKTLRAGLQQSQQVIIDHLMETNEALLKWFQMKKIL